MPRPPVPAFLVALALAAVPGCDFFRELDSAESAGGTGGTGGTDTGTAGTGPCAPEDDTCLDQDRLRWCDPQTGAVEEQDCTAVCGQYVNFTCLQVAPSTHACWCVEPGAQKVYGCAELEACLQGCGLDPDGTCTDPCFARTTARTIRTFGALVHCAHAACEATCDGPDPDACAACIDSAMAGTYGGCALARSVCDADRGDEPWP